MVRTAMATRYVLPLREGGSLPAIVEADDLGIYVVKFRGAGQGVRALVAELVAGEIGRALGLPVPEIIFIEIDAALSRNEPDYEIRHLLKASAGLNLALDYLPGSTTFVPAARDTVSSAQASLTAWFDAFTQNVDRTPRNANLLVWHRKLYLIDRGVPAPEQGASGDQRDQEKVGRKQRDPKGERPCNRPCPPPATGPLLYLIFNSQPQPGGRRKAHGCPAIASLGLHAGERFGGATGAAVLCCMG
jgi:hypothetical protein